MVRRGRLGWIRRAIARGPPRATRRGWRSRPRRRVRAAAMSPTACRPTPIPRLRQATVDVNDSRVTVAQEAAACRITVAIANATVPSTGGSVVVTVTSSAAMCPWTAAASVNWITLTTSATSSGSGTATFTVASNTGIPRTGRIAVAGQTYTITQMGVGCDSTLSPGSASLDAAGGPVAVQVAAAAGCVWTSSTTAESGGDRRWRDRHRRRDRRPERRRERRPRCSPDNGNGRRNIIQHHAGGTTVAPPTPCTLRFLGTTHQSVDAGGSSERVSVTTSAACTWTATSNASWITVTGGASGTGSGSVTTRPLPTTAARTGTLTIAGSTLTVTQPAAACTIAVSPSSQSIPPTGGSGTFNVATPADRCSWTAGSNADCCRSRLAQPAQATASSASPPARIPDPHARRPSQSADTP